MSFFKDIVNVAKTRKFWVAMLNVVVTAVLVFLADTPEFAPLFALLASLGVYQIPNKT